MPIPEALRHQDLHLLTDKFIWPVAEQLFRPCVNRHDISASVDDDYSVRSHFEQLSKTLLAASAFLDFMVLSGVVLGDLGETEE